MQKNYIKNNACLKGTKVCPRVVWQQSLNFFNRPCIPIRVIRASGFIIAGLCHWVRTKKLIEDPDQKTLEQQIHLIEELAELEPDSKCTLSFTKRPGCMQSLAHYKQLLLSTWGDLLDASVKDTLATQIKELLERLSVIDPLRQHRYEDLLKAIHAHQHI